MGQDSAGYSVLKAAAFALGYVGADQAKEEIQTHQQLRDLYAGYGFTPHSGAHSFLVPLASAHLPCFEPHGQRLQQELRQKMTAQSGRFDADEADWLRRRLGRKAMTLAGDGDAFSQLPVLGELIDLQRGLEVFATAGASEVALPPTGRVQFPKITGGSTAYWVGEGSPITESQPATGEPRTDRQKVGRPGEAQQRAVALRVSQCGGLVRLDMARSCALKADAAMLEGAGGTQIRGLLTYPDIVTHAARVQLANGNRFMAEDAALMEAKLPDAVEAPTAWVMRKTLYAGLIANRRASAAERRRRAGAVPAPRPRRLRGAGQAAVRHQGGAQQSSLVKPRQGGE